MKFSLVINGTALSIAIEKNHYQIVQLLLSSNDLDVNSLIILSKIFNTISKSIISIQF